MHIEEARSSFWGLLKWTRVRTYVCAKTYPFSTVSMNSPLVFKNSNRLVIPTNLLENLSHQGAENSLSLTRMCPKFSEKHTDTTQCDEHHPRFHLGLYSGWGRHNRLHKKEFTHELSTGSKNMVSQALPFCNCKLATTLSKLSLSNENSTSDTNSVDMESRFGVLFF